MGILKVSLRVFGVGAGLALGLGCGGNPRTQFEGEVKGMIKMAGEGRYGELEKVMSVGLVEKIRREGWEPRVALGAGARKDREERATYFLRDVPKFEGRYAEAEIGRVVGEREKRIVIPFVMEEGGWRVGAAFKDGRGWEAEDF